MVSDAYKRGYCTHFIGFEGVGWRRIHKAKDELVTGRIYK